MPTDSSKTPSGHTDWLSKPRARANDVLWGDSLVQHQRIMGPERYAIFALNAYFWTAEGIGDDGDELRVELIMALFDTTYGPGYKQRDKILAMVRRMCASRPKWWHDRAKGKGTHNETESEEAYSQSKEDDRTYQQRGSDRRYESAKQCFLLLEEKLGVGKVSKRALTMRARCHQRMADRVVEHFNTVRQPAQDKATG
jgi:hypothetical protein